IPYRAFREFSHYRTKTLTELAYSQRVSELFRFRNKCNKLERILNPNQIHLDLFEAVRLIGDIFNSEIEYQVKLDDYVRMCRANLVFTTYVDSTLRAISKSMRPTCTLTQSLTTNSNVQSNLRAIVNYLREIGFKGANHYYHRKNSSLRCVMAKRKGIPITL